MTNIKKAIEIRERTNREIKGLESMIKFMEKKAQQQIEEALHADRNATGQHSRKRRKYGFSIPLVSVWSSLSKKILFIKIKKRAQQI